MTAILSQPQDSLPDVSAASLRQLIMGFRVTQLVYVAAKLGLADHLQQGPQPPKLLAQAVGAEPRALYRLLRALASLGLFAEMADGAFAFTPLAQLLQSNVAGSLRSLAILYGEEWLWQAYGRMLHSVQTGQPAFEHAHGQPLFDYLHDHPTAAAQFHEATTGYSAQKVAAILDAYDFSNVTTLVDVGGIRFPCGGAIAGSSSTFRRGFRSCARGRGRSTLTRRCRIDIAGDVRCGRFLHLSPRRW